MKELEQKLGYSFRDRGLLENALRHSSFANESRDRSVTSNERLEFLGYSVLGFVAAKHLYKLFPNLPEGRMTKVRAELVCENALHKVAVDMPNDTPLVSYDGSVGVDLLTASKVVTFNLDKMFYRIDR